MRKKRVLLLSEGFGAGHTQAAQAMAVGLRQLSPQLHTKVLELGAFLHPTLAPWVFSAYRKTVTAQPRLYGFMYKYQYKKSLNRFSQLALHRIFYAQTAEIINHLKPNTIVCTHPFPNVVISRLKRSGLNVPLCTVITDYDAHGTWISPEVNKYLVSTEDVRNKLLARGVEADKIQVTGIPIHPNFWEHNNKEELRLRYELKPMPTVMVMGGGWGFNNEQLFNHIAGWREHIQILFCLGKNEKIRAKLAEHDLYNHPNIRLLGFTNEIDKLMDVSDLLITKPGGMTCTEGFTKGLPMLFYNPIPGQEEENCHYFTQRGYGAQITSVETIDYWFNQLLHRNPHAAERRHEQNSPLHSYNPTDCLEAVMKLLEIR